MTKECDQCGKGGGYALYCVACAEKFFGNKEWVSLTDKEIDQGLLHSNYALQTASAWWDGVEWAIKQLKEKNT